MIRRPPRSTPLYSSAASDVYKRQKLYMGKNSESTERSCLGQGRDRRQGPLSRHPKIYSRRADCKGYIVKHLRTRRKRRRLWDHPSPWLLPSRPLVLYQSAPYSPSSGDGLFKHNSITATQSPSN